MHSSWRSCSRVRHIKQPYTWRQAVRKERSTREEKCEKKRAPCWMHFRSSNPPFFVFTFNPFGIKQALKCCNGTRSACRTKVTTFVYSTLVAAPCCPSKKSFLANASLAPSLSILHQQIGCCNRTTRKKGKSFWKSRKGFCLFHAIFDLASSEKNDDAQWMD